MACMVPLVVKWSWRDSWITSRELTVEEAISDLEQYRERYPKRAVKFSLEFPEVALWEQLDDNIEAAIGNLRCIADTIQDEITECISEAHQYEGKAHAMLKAWWCPDDTWTSSWHSGNLGEMVVGLEQNRESLKGSVHVRLKYLDTVYCDEICPSVDAAMQALQQSGSHAAEQVAPLLAVRFNRAARRRSAWGTPGPSWGHLGASWTMSAPSWRHLQGLVVGTHYPDQAEREYSCKCVECTLPVDRHCHICGLALCKQHITMKAMSSGSKAQASVPVCQLCSEKATTYAATRTAMRDTRAREFRSNVRDNTVGALSAPLLENAKDCAVCGTEFGVMAGLSMLRHSCCACRRALCAICFCGSYTCMGTGRCPHKIQLQVVDIEATEKVCKDCLECVTARIAASLAVRQFVLAADKYLEHRRRVIRFLDNPDAFPHYEQDYVDSGIDKLKRGGGLVAKGAKLIAPILPGGWGIAANAAKAVYDYGHYGLLGFFIQSEIAESLKVLASASSVLQEVGARDLLIGGMYLSIDQRKALRNDPEHVQKECEAHGSPAPRDLFDALLGFAALGLHAPYQENAFEAQRFALQQNWRLVSERLKESWQHKPAWCLFVHVPKQTVVIAVRGTDPDKSAGGDLFTDFNALPESTVGYDGKRMTAHCGMLASARTLELELWPALRELVARRLRIIFVGHSLGAGVVALLVWLTKHGRYGQWFNDNNAQISGIGYATPSVVDRETADMMKPYFVTVVNPVDVVPRLSLSTLTNLAAEIRASARDSQEHFAKDTQDQIDHALTVWQPRLRSNLGIAEAGQDVNNTAVDEAGGDEGLPQLGRTISQELRIFEVAEGSMFDMPPGGAENINRAWFGNSKFQWSDDEGHGQFCTDSVKDLLTREGQFRVSTQVLGINPAPRLRKQLLVEMVHSELRTLRCSDGAELIIPAGSASVVRAWYGDYRRPWQVREGTGAFCTKRVQELTAAKGVVTVSAESLDVDPSPGRAKCLLVDVWQQVEETDLFCAGSITAIYRSNGGLQAAMVPCDLPSLRRITFDKRLFTDHKYTEYNRALLNVHARMKIMESNPEALVRWQGFLDASRICPCCHNDYAWMRTAQSEKQRFAAMTNCRACGIVVCTGCASTRRSLPEQGILEPARVCDRCAFSAPDGGVAMWRLTEILASG